MGVSKMSLKWAQRYYQSEIDLAKELLADIDDAAETLSRVRERDELGNRSRGGRILA